MESNSYWQLEKDFHTLAPNHDLIIRVIERKKVTRSEGDGATGRNVTDLVAVKLHDVKVERATLINAAAYFQKLLEGSFNESQQGAVVELHEDSAETAQALIVWLKLLHRADVKSTHTQTTPRGVWEVLAAAHKYGFEPTSHGGSEWFAGWYAANQHNANWKDGTEGETRFAFRDYQELLFPCYAFDYAVGFAAATKFLVYHGKGHVVEMRPEGFRHDHLRLDQRVIQQINAAKGRLKTILHRHLYKPIDNLLQHARCNCKEKMLYAYEKSLSQTGAWPLETAYQSQSMTEILNKLEAFPDKTKSVAMPDSCGSCGFGPNGVVKVGSGETERYFDGLCLDCMDASKAKFGDADEDYWRHAERKEWDDRCRIHHKQPTWYFSFMGRREKMIQWTQRKRERDNSYYF